MAYGAGTRKAGPLTPPSVVTAPKKIVEDQADNDPLSQVPGRGRRNETSRTKDGREEDVAEDTSWVPPRNKELNGRKGKSKKPEPVGPGVEGARSCFGDVFGSVSGHTEGNTHSRHSLPV